MPRINIQSCAVVVVVHDDDDDDVVDYLFLFFETEFSRRIGPTRSYRRRGLERILLRIFIDFGLERMVMPTD